MGIATRCLPAAAGGFRGWRKPGADHNLIVNVIGGIGVPRHDAASSIGWSTSRDSRGLGGDKIDSKPPRWRSRGGSAYATPQIGWHETNASRMFATLSAQQRFGRLTGTSRNVAILPGPICAQMRLMIGIAVEMCRRYPQFHPRNPRAATLRTYLSPNSGRWSVA
jgi:hypothetical protein